MFTPLAHFASEKSGFCDFGAAGLVALHWNPTESMPYKKLAYF
jgi:hypothetical protein